MAESTLQTKLGGEFLGTFLLIFTVGCNVLSGNAVWGGVSIASVLMVAVYALGGISGANFNPAVSFALALTESAGGKGLDWKTAGMYMGVQVFAGVVAATCYIAFFWDSFNLEPAKGFGWIEAGLCETLYTFMLCFVVLNVAVAKNNSPNSYYGLAIGYVIVAGAYGAGAVSGGCFNPAVAIGIDIASAGIGFGWCCFYTLCELAGGALAAAAFIAVRPEDFGREKTVLSEYLSEFIGTFFLVLTVGLNVLGHSPAGAFSIAASLMCMIYALGDVSGAHFNPAVTVAILLSGRVGADFPPSKGLQFILAQFGGALAAGWSYVVIRKGDTFALAPGIGMGWSQVAVAETIFTFVLCYVVLAVAVATTTKSTAMFGLAIGACVTVGGNAIGGISGGSLNPAVSIAIAGAHMKSSGIFAFLFYSLFECLGAAMAAGVFFVTHAVDLDAGTKDDIKA